LALSVNGKARLLIEPGCEPMQFNL
jgi:hypothetical protein